MYSACCGFGLGGVAVAVVAPAIKVDKLGGSGICLSPTICIGALVERGGVSADFDSGVTWVIRLGFPKVAKKHLYSGYGDKTLNSLRHGHAFIAIGGFHVIQKSAELPI